MNINNQTFEFYMDLNNIYFIINYLNEPMTQENSHKINIISNYSFISKEEIIKNIL